MDSSLAPCAVAAGTQGPVRVLSLVIFLQDTEEEEAGGKKEKEMAGGLEMLTAGFYECNQLH